MADEKKLLGMIGMCRGAGRAVIGVPMICEYLKKASQSKKGTADILVIEASDTSDNTHKRISDRCEFYNVRCIRISSNCSELGRALGKAAVAAVAIVDASFCRAIEGKLTEADQK